MYKYYHIKPDDFKKVVEHFRVYRLHRLEYYKTKKCISNYILCMNSNIILNYLYETNNKFMSTEIFMDNLVLYLIREGLDYEKPIYTKDFKIMYCVINGIDEISDEKIDEFISKLKEKLHIDHKGIEKLINYYTHYYDAKNKLLNLVKPMGSMPVKIAEKIINNNLLIDYIDNTNLVKLLDGKGMIISKEDLWFR